MGCSNNKKQKSKKTKIKLIIIIIIIIIKAKDEIRENLVTWYKLALAFAVNGF